MKNKNNQNAPTLQTERQVTVVHPRFEIWSSVETSLVNPLAKTNSIRFILNNNNNKLS